MNYSWLSYEDIEKSKYPNLLAEIKESGYSICTVSDHMGLGYRPEDDKEIWDKLTGRKDIFASECIGIINLFGVRYEYIFSNELRKVDGIPYAHLRWYKENQQKAAEHQLTMTQQELYVYWIPEIAKIAVKCREKTDTEYAAWKKEVIAGTPEDVKDFMQKVLIVVDKMRKKGVMHNESNI